MWIRIGQTENSLILWSTSLLGHFYSLTQSKYLWAFVTPLKAIRVRLKTLISDDRFLLRFELGHGRTEGEVALTLSLRRSSTWSARGPPRHPRTGRDVKRSPVKKILIKFVKWNWPKAWEAFRYLEIKSIWYCLSIEFVEWNCLTDRNYR